MRLKTFFLYFFVLLATAQALPKSQALPTSKEQYLEFAQSPFIRGPVHDDINELIVIVKNYIDAVAKALENIKASENIFSSTDTAKKKQFLSNLHVFKDQMKDSEFISDAVALFYLGVEPKKEHTNPSDEQEQSVNTTPILLSDTLNKIREARWKAYNVCFLGEGAATTYEKESVVQEANKIVTTKLRELLGQLEQKNAFFEKLDQTLQDYDENNCFLFHLFRKMEFLLGKHFDTTNPSLKDTFGKLQPWSIKVIKLNNTYFKLFKDQVEAGGKNGSLWLIHDLPLASEGA